MLGQRPDHTTKQVKVTQSCPILCDPMDCTVHGILQASILEWVAVPFSSKRLSSKGLAYDYPVASNDTEAGRAQNRRVEIYITANEDMVKAAQEGTLE